MSQLTINTTQNVKIIFTAANVGERMLGSLIDYFVKIAYVFFIVYFVFNLLKFEKVIDKLNGFSYAAALIILFFPILVYTLVLESIWEGQTIGKKLMKIKVVKIDGYQASFIDYFIRWIFRIIENNSILSIVGIVAMASTDRTQRLGDMAAGTAVISLKNNINISSTILTDIGDSYVPIYPAVIKLSDNDMRIIKDSFLLARKKGDYETVRKLCVRIEKVAEIKNQSGNDADFIKTVLKDYNFYTQNM